MADEEILGRIHRLVDQEHDLERERSGRALTDEEREQLRDLEVALDQCWDLLRQRRANRHAGKDPDEAHVRDATTVEGYRQ
jgi:Protein of unknown function (DUF2630)